MPLQGRSGFSFLALLVILSLPAASHGQALYSYLDESGIRVYTNIPPKAAVRDLKVIGAPVPPPAPAPNPVPATPYDSIIEKYSNQYQVDPSLIHSMIATESGFNAKAVSSKGARGLMQLMPATASRLGVRDVFNPEENIRGGVKHMRNLLDTFSNDLELSLAAYNAGENLVQRVRRIPNIRETHDYVRSITNRYGKKDVTFQAAEPARAPSTFRWVDENGIEHLTNIPPVLRSGFEFPLLTGPSQSPQ